MDVDKCYMTNNRFAYKYDANGEIPYDEMKTYNFVPTYDPWCLYCDKKGCSKKCSSCKCIYFCDDTCQKKAWPIHKKHCKRDLFILCLTCGSSNINPELNCKNCPVKYCSESCKNDLDKMHIEYDCAYFSKTFK